MSSDLTTAIADQLSALMGFLRSEAAGGAVLIVAAAVALIWSNSPFAASYFHLLHLPLGVSAGEASFALPLHDWINDALMVVFFLLVTLEIRREMADGQLSSLSTIAAPGIAAVGGMVVPAAIYLGWTWGDSEDMRGWAIPTATDIAFSLAVLSVLGRRVPLALKVFLTALAIIDDLGAILVIGLVYTGDLVLGALGLAALVWVALLGLNRAGVRALWPYLLGGVMLWACVFRSGLHPTIAGVALAFAVPMRHRAGERHSPGHRLEHALTGAVAFVVLPLFGLANVGLRFDALPPGTLTDPVVLGVVLGLVAGKQVGVFGATMAAIQLGWARLPNGLSPLQLYGAAILCGIGFTMSLFIGDLAFGGEPREVGVKLGVFAASLVAALLGLAVLAVATRRQSQDGQDAWPGESQKLGGKITNP